MLPERSSIPIVRVKISLDPERFTVLVMAGADALVLVSFGNFLAQTHNPNGFSLPARMFDVNRESNLPTWYQVLNLAFAAVLAAGIAQAATSWRRH